MPAGPVKQPWYIEVFNDSDHPLKLVKSIGGDWKGQLSTKEFKNSDPPANQWDGLAENDSITAAAPMYNTLIFEIPGYKHSSYWGVYIYTTVQADGTKDYTYSIGWVENRELSNTTVDPLKDHRMQNFEQNVDSLLMGDPNSTDPAEVAIVLKITFTGNDFGPGFKKH